MPDILSDEERAAAEAQILSELQDAHDQRGKARKAAHVISEVEEAILKDAEYAQLRLQVQRQFFIDNGYEQYTDSRGVIRYVPPGEAEKKKQRRKKRARKWTIVSGANFESWLVYVGLGVFMSAIIFALLR